MGWDLQAQSAALDVLQACAPEQLSDEFERTMLRYALKLTRTPSAVAKADIDALRAVGMDDRAIHDLCAIVAYFAFVNRVADGLGVELEE